MCLPGVFMQWDQETRDYFAKLYCGQNGKAQKDYHCLYCGGIISRGTRYVSSIKKVRGPDGHFYSENHPMHDDCYWGTQTMIFNHKRRGKKKALPRNFNPDFGKSLPGGTDGLCLWSTNIQGKET